LRAVLSGNTHNRSLDLVMKARCVTGPIGALIGAIAGALTRVR
jgi:hypothetical protein